MRSNVVLEIGTCNKRNLQHPLFRLLVLAVGANPFKNTWDRVAKVPEIGHVCEPVQKYTFEWTGHRWPLGHSLKVSYTVTISKKLKRALIDIFWLGFWHIMCSRIQSAEDSYVHVNLIFCWFINCCFQPTGSKNGSQNMRRPANLSYYITTHY